MSNATVSSVIPHLIIAGAAQALEFYKAAFGAEIVTSMTMPDSERILHATMTLGGHEIYVCDEFPENAEQGGMMRAPTSVKGTTVSVALNTNDTDALYARAVKAGASEHMAPENTFWGARYAQVLDPYGHLWEINQAVATVSPEDAKAALAESVAQAGK